MSNPRDEPHPNLRVAIATLAFVVYAGIGIAHHEMWRDEHHAWLLARDAANPIRLMENLRWDMTPGFWHFLLWIVTRFTHDPRAMQVLNLVFASGAAWVVLRYAPLSFGLRLLIVFGYYFGYEYAVISRVYALGTLFVVVLCVLWPARAAHPIAIGLLLTLLANTPSLYGVIAAGFFILLLVFDLRGRVRTRSSAGKALVVGFLGTVIALIQTLPRSDNPFAQGKATMALEPERLVQVVRYFASIFIPIPNTSRYEYWNSNLVIGRSLALDLVIAGIALSLVLFVLWRRRALLASWLMVSAGVLFAAYQGGFVGLRHGGFVMITFVAALWLGRSEEDGWFDSRRVLAVTLILAIGVIAGLTAWGAELVTEFSAVERTARFLHAEGLDRLPIAGADDFAVASLASLLDLDRIYYPQRSSWGTFVSWDPERRLQTTLGDATADVASRVAASNRPMIFVLTLPPTRPGPNGDQVIREAMLAPAVRARLLAAFTKSVVPDERMFVYEVAPVRRAGR